MLNEEILICEATSSDQYGYRCLPSLFCRGFHLWFEEEDCLNAVSLNNRNTDRQLPCPEGVRLKSWSIFLCNICIKMAGSAPASCCSLCSLPLSASSPNLCPRGVQLPHHWGVNTLINLPFTFDTWYVKARVMFRSNERCFDNVNISLQHAE